MWMTMEVQMIWMTITVGDNDVHNEDDSDTDGNVANDEGTDEYAE